MGRPKLIKVDVTDGRGLGGAKVKTVDVRTRIPNILAYRDAPIFAYLLLAANPDTPVPVLRKVLEAVGPHQEHPETWMYERRQMLSAPTFPPGMDERAISFVEKNMSLPSWKLHAEMRKKGMKCSLAKVHRIWMAIRYLSIAK